MSLWSSEVYEQEHTQVGEYASSCSEADYERSHKLEVNYERSHELQSSNSVQSNSYQIIVQSYTWVYIFKDSETGGGGKLRRNLRNSKEN